MPFFAPPPRSKRSPLLRRSPRLARLRGQLPQQNNPNVTRSRRIMRVLGSVAVLLVAGLVLRGWTSWRFDVARQIERAARAQYIPQLEKQIGQKIEVGSFSTDWLGRIQIQDIVVGRNAKLPTGSLIQAKTATITLDLVGLALGRTKFPDAITAVDLDSPSVYVRRLRNGKLNLASLVPSTSQGTGTRWTGRVGVKNGRAFYADELIANLRKQNLEVDTRGINGQVRVSSPAPKSSAIDFVASPQQTLLLGQNLGIFPLRGHVVSADGTPARGWAETQTPFLPVTLASQWARLPVVLEGGTVGGKVQLAFANQEFAPRGTITVRNGALRVSRPGGTPVPIRALNGPLAFAGTAVETQGISAQVAGATWTAKGRAAFDTGAQPLFDGDIATKGLSLANVRALVGPNVVPPQLQASTLDVSAHASGTPQDLRGDGTLSARQVAWSDAQGRGATFPVLRANGVVARSGSQPLQIAARFQAPNGEVQTPLPRVRSLTVRAQSCSGSVRGAGQAWDVDARADNIIATSPVLGRSSAPGARLVASSADIKQGNWRGALQLDRASTSGVRLAALFPRASLLQRSGIISGRFNFEGSPARIQAARAQGTLSLSDITLSSEAIPPGARAQVSRVLGPSFDVRSLLFARDLRASVSLAGGQLQVRDARAQTAVGPVLASFATSLQNFAPRYTFASPQLSVPPTLFLDAARAQGVQLNGPISAKGSVVGEGNASGATVRAVLALSAPRFQALSRNSAARLEGTGAVLRVAGNLAGTAARWNALLNCDSLAAQSGKLGTTGLTVPGDLSGLRVAGVQVVAASRALARNARGNLAWTTSVSASRAALPLRTIQGKPLVTLRSLNAVINPLAGGIAIPRLSALWGETGRVDGTLALSGGQVSGDILAREVEAQALQTLLAQTSRRGARLDGRLNFQATIRPNEPPRVSAQMPSGSVTLPSANRTINLPIRGLGVQTEVQNGVVRFTNARAFVGQARIEGEGRASLNVGRIETDVRLDGLSLAPFVSGLSGSGSQQVAGLVRGRASLSYNTRTSQIATTARVHLDGGAFRGISLDETDASVKATWNLSQATGSLSVRDWRGELEGAPFTGEVAVDDEANTWSVQLAAQKISLQNVARLKARLQNASATDDNVLRLAPPVGGEANVVLDLKGALRDTSNRFVFRPESGLARLSVPALQWHARPLGTLTGTFNVADGRVSFAPLQLEPPDDSNGNAPTISLVGSIPLDTKKGDLDARLSVGEAPLDFFIQTLQESRDALGATDVTSPFLESVVSYGSKLPRGLTGRIALEARFGGTFRNPVFQVSSLSLRDGRAPLPLGGLSLPASLDAGFTFANGEVVFDRAEFRLAKNEKGKTAAGASPPPDPNAEEEDDTVVQIPEGAKISIDGQSDLTADVYNANLSQLAPWVPALRGRDGQTLLSGELEGFSIRLRGPARDPIVTGSVEAQNISYSGRTLERLRVSRFNIGNGVAQIEPGNLSIKEGRFESSAASGSVAWSWATGPIPDGALKLQFPFATRDFGALIALFAPGIAGARAEEFAGTIEVGGTVRAPQFQGNVSVRDASFRTASSPTSPVALGVQHLSGALRFVNGRRLEIASDNPITGELVSADNIAPEPTAPPSAAMSSVSKDAATAAKKTTLEKAQTDKVAQTGKTDALRARGNFKLLGSVEIGRGDLTQIAADLPSAVASNIYDLRLDVDKAGVDAPGTSGLQNAAFSASFRTTSPANAAQSQTIRWIGAGNGQGASKKVSGGEVLTRGAILLRPDFASGFSSLVRSTPLPWASGTNDLNDAAVAPRVQDAEFVDQRPQIVFKGFGGKLNDYGSAVLDGRLLLDKAAATNRAPDAARLQTISGQPSLRPIEPVTGARLFGAWKDNALIAPPRTRPPLVAREVQEEGVADNTELPIRLGGNLVVSNAQISGGGSGDGQVTRLSFLPDAPRLDIRLSLGRNVELVNSTLRARLGGDVALSGTPRNPLLLGTVEVLEGQVRFPNARARIEDGRVSINVTRDAETDLLRIRLEVDATARGTAGRYTITLRLRGPLQFDSKDSQNKSNLQIDVSSNPPLSQDEAFAQLLGVLPREFTNANGSVNVSQANQAYAQAVLQLVSAPFFSGFERSVAQALGLSSVSFEYRFNEPLAFEISKAVGDRVLVTYRRSLGATSTSVGRTPYEFRIDYRLKGEYYVGLRYDERQVSTLTLQKSWRF